MSQDKFKLFPDYEPMGDQPTAIGQLLNGLDAGMWYGTKPPQQLLSAIWTWN